MVKCLVDKRKAVDVVYLVFSTPFDTVFLIISTEKWEMCRLNEQMVRWIKTCLNGQAIRVVISSSNLSSRLIT